MPAILKETLYPLLLVPGHLPVHFLDRAIHTSELIANLDHAEANHSRIKTQKAAHVLLSLDRGIELHDEVVALTVLGLVFCGRTREVDMAPVLQTSDDAGGGEHLGAGNAGDPRRRVLGAW